MSGLPNLSRFELQCLRRLWARKEATVRDIFDDMDNPPSYSTVRKIIERLEEKGAVTRVRMAGKAWIYRSAVPATSMSCLLDDWWSQPQLLYTSHFGWDIPHWGHHQ